MALIYELKTTWSEPIALEQDEIWQARYGSVFVTTSDAPEDDDGLALVQNDGIRLKAGLQVRYRKEGGTGALIAREVV